jgi:hypothetical protein
MLPIRDTSRRLTPWLGISDSNFDVRREYSRVGLIRIEDEGHWIGPRIEVPRACGTSADEPHENNKTRVWLSPTDMNNLIGNETFGSGQELHAILTPLPRNLSPEISGQ